MGYYIDLGALKVVYGRANFSWSAAANASGVNSISMPSSFLTSTYAYLPAVSSVGTSNNQYLSGGTHGTSSVTFYVKKEDNLNGPTLQVSFLVIGS